MNIIGFSSGGAGHLTNTDRMVQAVLEKSGHQTEFVKLTELNYSACRGCVSLCAKPQVCNLEDDATPYYQKIKDADAVVMGAPVYGGSINATALSFMERFYGYRHVTPALKDKPFVAVVCGFRMIDAGVEQIQKKIKSTGANLLETVTFISGSPP
ncbi:MAG: flavodoxin family protein [Dehalococcoidales bacterium]